METFAVILFLPSMAAGIYIVNKLYRLYMRIMNIDYMTYSGKQKLAYIFVVTSVIWVLILRLLSIV